MIELIRQIGVVSTLWEILSCSAVVWVIVVLLVLVVTLAQRTFARLTHAVLVELLDSHFELGYSNMKLLEALHVQKLRSIDTGEVEQLRIRIAQEVTSGRSHRSYEKKCIARVLGQWVESEFNGLESQRARCRLVLGVKRLLDVDVLVDEPQQP